MQAAKDNYRIKHPRTHFTLNMIQNMRTRGLRREDAGTIRMTSPPFNVGLKDMLLLEAHQTTDDGVLRCPISRIALDEENPPSPDRFLTSLDLNYNVTIIDGRLVDSTFYCIDLSLNTK